MTRELICISCPVGCHLAVTVQDDTVQVSGNRCPKGEIYGREEMLAPKRVVTAVARCASQSVPYVSVKTDTPLPRELIRPLLNAIYQQTAEPPLQIGDIFIPDYRGSGVNVVFTAAVKSRA